MKKNKYIGIAYLMFISSVILITYIDAKAHGIASYEKRINIKKIGESINDFNVLVAGKNTKISIVNDTVNQLYQTYFVRNDNQQKDTFAFGKDVSYYLHGDTLFIDKTGKRTLNISTKEISHIIAKEKSKINLSEFDTKQLKIESKFAKINGRKNNIKYLDIKASDHSNINFYDSKIDTLKVLAKASKIYNNRNKTNSLVVKLKNNAYLGSSETNTLKIITDKTSRYRIEGK